jgi:hypothetical protein
MIAVVILQFQWAADAGRIDARVSSAASWPVEEKGVGVPQCIWPQNGRVQILHTARGSDKDMRAGQANDWQVGSYQFLNTGI